MSNVAPETDGYLVLSRSSSPIFTDTHHPSTALSVPWLSQAEPQCTCNGQLWKPKPSLPPSLLPACTMGTCFLAFTPSPDKTRTLSQTRTLKCTSCPRPSLFLFLRALCLWSKTPVIRCLWFFV